jgi:hypothetical protein
MCHQVSPLYDFCFLTACKRACSCVNVEAYCGKIWHDMLHRESSYRGERLLIIWLRLLGLLIRTWLCLHFFPRLFENGYGAIPSLPKEAKRDVTICFTKHIRVVCLSLMHPVRFLALPRDSASVLVPQCAWFVWVLQRRPQRLQQPKSEGLGIFQRARLYSPLE